MLTFFMWKMYLTFWIDVYVIFLYQNICINYKHFMSWFLFEIVFMHAFFWLIFACLDQ